jgi:hypothetical protein
MRILSLLFVASIFGVLLGAEPGLAQDTSRKPALAAAKKPRQPYDGLWSSTAKKCMDRDGVERMFVEGGHFYWYENQCRAHDIKAIDAHSWSMRMSCEGEGLKYSVKPRLLLPTPNRLIFADQPPVGTTKREAYVRCDEKRAPRSNR